MLLSLSMFIKIETLSIQLPYVFEIVARDYDRLWRFPKKIVFETFFRKLLWMFLMTGRFGRDFQIATLKMYISVFKSC